MAKNKKKQYSVSLVENFTEGKIEICVSDYRAGKTASIPVKEAKNLLNDLKKLIKQIKKHGR